MHKFFDNLDTNIYRLVYESYQVLSQQITKESTLYQLQIPKAQARWDLVIESTPRTKNKMVKVVYYIMLNLLILHKN
jgi:hypothetical protein